MKTRKEILEYLFVSEDDEIANSVITSSLLIEQKYKEQLKNHIYGYGLECDFHAKSLALEDSIELKEIENINGVIVYEII